LLAQDQHDLIEPIADQTRRAIGCWQHLSLYIALSTGITDEFGPLEPIALPEMDEQVIVGLFHIPTITPIETDLPPHLPVIRADYLLRTAITYLIYPEDEPLDASTIVERCLYPALSALMTQRSYPMFKLFKMMFRPTPRWITAVQTTGTPAIAVILATPKEVETLHSGVGYEGRDGWLEVSVQVRPTDAAPFEAGMTCKLSQALFGRLAAGMQVNVRYDPTNPNRVVLVDDVHTLLRSRAKQ